MLLTIDNIKVNVTYNNIKNMYLRVVPPNGDVLVSAPRNMPQLEIEKFIESKREWIKKQRKAILEKSKQAHPRLASGETLYVWGEKYTIQMISDSTYNLELIDKRAIIKVPSQNCYEQHIDFLQKWQSNQVCAALEKIIPNWEEKTGLYAYEYRIRYMKTRWGSCNPQNRRIRFNTHLINFPLDCLEYVILHELAHLKIPGHQKDFKDYLTKYMPNWQSKKKKLNDLNKSYGHLTIITM